jgi:antibiotic biosynthesis monooxygenase (ABM) superfamily enzyme
VNQESHPPDDTRVTPATLGAAWSPATAVITRDLQPDRDADYQEWSQRLIAAAARVPGYEGATLVGPPHDEPGRRLMMLRFSDKEALQRWVDSGERQALTAEADAFSTHVYQEPTSLETWFAIPGLGTVEPPPRWKMALVTAPASYVLAAIVLLALSPIIEDWPFLLANVVVTILLVLLLTYVAMPVLTRMFRPWLYPSQAHQRATLENRSGAPSRR